MRFAWIEALHGLGFKALDFGRNSNCFEGSWLRPLGLRGLGLRAVGFEAFGFGLAWMTLGFIGFRSSLLGAL